MNAKREAALTCTIAAGGAIVATGLAAAAITRATEQSLLLALLALQVAALAAVAIGTIYTDLLRSARRAERVNSLNCELRDMRNALAMEIGARQSRTSEIEAAMQREIDTLRDEIVALTEQLLLSDDAIFALGTERDRLANDKAILLAEREHLCSKYSDDDRE